MDFDHFKSLKYDIIVRKRKDKFVLFISELGLIKEDQNLEQAYRKIETAKEEYFKSMIGSDLSDRIQEPSNLKSKRKFTNNITNFTVKAMIVIFIGIIGAYFILTRVESFVSASMMSLGRSVSLGKIADESKVLLDKINNIPDQKIENARQKIRKTAKKYKPLIDELRMMLKENQENTPEQANLSEEK
jgi:hypothetical protein